MANIGIRIEDKYLMERRVAIIPEDIKKLKTENSISFQVQKSPKRVFTDEEYDFAEADMVSEIKDASIVFGVKEMPLEIFEEEKTYVFFSHTIKGQDYNMPLLKKMIEKKINLIEYEKIEDDEGKRIIFFGRHAGLAGMINSFWSFGQRCQIKGFENPFSNLKQSHKYASLNHAIEAMKLAAENFNLNGIHSDIAPLTVGITGYGNVSKGAQEISDLFATEEISPKELLELRKSGNYNNNCLYKIIFKEEDISKPKSKNNKFDLQHYYTHAEAYENNFEQFVPELSILMNCMYWSPEYPRIITKDFLAEMYKKGEKKLCVIGDVTCDPDGSIEATHIGTHIEDPVFVYNPETRKPTMGFSGDGILVMSVDILPSELPREASEAFSKALFPFIPGLVKTDFNKSFDKLDIPAPFKRALILHRGEFTPDYQYMKEFI